MVKSSSSTIMYASSWGVMYSIIVPSGAGPPFLGALRWGGEVEGLRLGFVFAEGDGLVEGFDEEEVEVEERFCAHGSARGMIRSGYPVLCCAMLRCAVLVRVCWCNSSGFFHPLWRGCVVSYVNAFRTHVVTYLCLNTL